MRTFNVCAIWFLCLLTFILTVSEASEYTTSYTYDPLGRLIQADFDDGRFILYEYDKAGNLMSKVFGGPSTTCDVFVDDVIDLKDAIAALQAADGLAPEGIHTVADVDQDERIGVAEAICVLQTVAGIRE